jgi:hypothetical protein
VTRSEVLQNKLRYIHHSLVYELQCYFPKESFQQHHQQLKVTEQCLQLCTLAEMHVTVYERQLLGARFAPELLVTQVAKTCLEGQAARAGCVVKQVN